MHSLYYVLTSQHGDELAPVRANHQTVLRLVRYFEDVVTENKLSALVIQGRCLDGREPAREVERLNKLASVARHLYLFSCADDCSTKTWSPQPSPKLTFLQERDHHNIELGPFVLVMDPRFCGVLASSTLPDEPSGQGKAYEMVWTFEPNVVFTAIEYLMARISVQNPQQRAQFEQVLNASTPNSPSLRLALSLTTKLTMLMQRQNELEMATNRISSAISNTLELEKILQSAAEEVGRALKSRRVALVVYAEGTAKKPEGMSIYERPVSTGQNGFEGSHANGQTPTGRLRLSDIAQASLTIPGPLKAQIIYRNSIDGELVVEDDTPGRNWEDEEVLMLKTVSDQLAVAISHARLFRRVETQAMTDALTGLYNHRYFQERLERETRMADRSNGKVSLILLDLDRLKLINDTLGHRAGDAALRQVADLMRKTFRDVDICARYGGEEFVIILPGCSLADAKAAAERLRQGIESTPLNGRQLTASFGVTSYPMVAKTKEELIEMADRAMYSAKEGGRNRVEVFSEKNLEQNVDQNRDLTPEQNYARRT